MKLPRDVSTVWKVLQRDKDHECYEVAHKLISPDVDTHSVELPKMWFALEKKHIGSDDLGYGYF